MDISYRVVEDPGPSKQKNMVALQSQEAVNARRNYTYVRLIDELCLLLNGKSE